MTFIRTLMSFAVALLAVEGASSQAAVPTLSLEQAVAEALAHGADQVILTSNLLASRALNAQAQAKAGLTLAATLGYNASETWNDPARAQVVAGLSADPKVSTVGVATYDGALPQNVQGGVTLATPLTSVTMKGTQSYQPAPDGTLNQATQAGLTLSQVVWNGYPGGPAEATADKAALALAIAEWNAVANRSKLIVTVKQAFFTLLSAQESMNQLTQTRNQRSDSLRFTQAKHQLQQATDLDLKAAQINALSADLDWQAGQSALDVARRRLSNLMGRTSTEPFTAALEPDPSVPATSLDQAIAVALKNRPEPQIAQANARSAQIDAFSALGAALPSLNVSGGITYNRDWQTNKTSYIGVVGVSLGVPLIDAGAAGALSNQATAQRTVAESQYAQLVASIPVDVTEAWNAWQNNLQRYEVAVSSVEVAEGQRQVVQAQYEAGLKFLTDLQTAEIALSTAQFNLLKAKITAQLSALTLQSLLGL